ncbi:MAG: hypothetical protein PHG66_06105 [Candidatus Colwellbacteria bacterium]|nr:hypothetical protein [Candidatus Colwellbacteria bacterium]
MDPRSPWFPYTLKRSSGTSLGTPAFRKDVRFGWGLCGLSSTAEVLMNQTQSLAVGASVTEKKVFIEGRHYFGPDHQGAFASLRVSSRKNLGFVIGSRDETDFGKFTCKIGFHANRTGINPTIGVGWEF